MRSSRLFFLVVGATLLAGAWTAPLSARGYAKTPHPSAWSLGDYDDLVKEYKRAVRTHRKKLRDSDSREERRALRENHPALSFSPRFQALIEAGEAEAYLWLIENAKDRGVERADLFTEKSRLFEGFFSAGVAGEPLENGVELLLRDSTFRRGEGPAELDRLFALALEKAPTEADQVSLRVISAMRLARSGDEESKARGLSLLKALVEKHPDHPRMERVKKTLFALERLVIGAIAPGFAGKKIDGSPIQLSDYRGKVVVLDFFGFW